MLFKPIRHTSTEDNPMTISPEDIAATEEWESICNGSAVELSKEIEGSFVADDGGGAFVYIPFPGEVNSEGDEMHATVAVDQNEDGSWRNWFIQYDFGVEVWDSGYDYKADPKVVAAWVTETLSEYRKK
jgi:hypothetical protein